MPPPPEGQHKDVGKAQRRPPLSCTGVLRLRLRLWRVLASRRSRSRPLRSPPPRLAPPPPEALGRSRSRSRLCSRRFSRSAWRLRSCWRASSASSSLRRRSRSRARAARSACFWSYCKRAKENAKREQSAVARKHVRPTSTGKGQPREYRTRNPSVLGFHSSLWGRQKDTPWVRIFPLSCGAL